MTTGRINQVARPPRQANVGFRTKLQPGQLSLFRRDRVWKERGAEAASSYTVSVIRDRSHKRGSLGGTSLWGRYHEATPLVLHSWSATPERCTQQRQHV